jgi:uncharacterized protein (TIGR02466 family)
MDLELTTIDESFEIEPFTLWQSQCFISENPYHALLKKELISCIYQDAQRNDISVKSDVAVGAKLNLQESELDFLDADDANIQTLNSFLSELIVTVATETNQGFWPEDADVDATITESWYHITKNGGYHDAHSHPNCSWCGIYYLDPGEADFNQKSGVNRFYDPRVNADHYLDAGSQYLNSTGIWDIEPVEGQVIIFPSYLKHSALPYFGQSDRVVIAFNARVDFI